MARPSSTSEHGFTLIELLVVILILGILAAIALPIFLNQRTKAQDTEAKSAATVVSTAFTVWHQDHGTYEGATQAGLAEIEPVIASARDLLIFSTPTTYTISVASASLTSGGGPYMIAGGLDGVERTCTVRNKGGCPDDLHW